MKSQSSSVTAIVTAYDRAAQTISTLRAIHACDPSPDEVIVHVDGSQNECEKLIRETFPNVRVIQSKTRVGPGGGRNKLMEVATSELVASFDDDSYPLDKDYFKRVRSLFERFPDASILSAALYHRGESIPEKTPVAQWTADFCGGACIYRRSAFIETGGYVPLPVAYGMEEVDLALRLHAAGGRILSTSALRVFHDTDLARHRDPTVTANSLANLALLAYLRYPPSFWLIGLGQCLNRVWWLLRHRRWRGVLDGVTMIPDHLRSHQQYRMPVRRDRLMSYRSLRRASVPQPL
jgi:GT2 family glycosyltransferase